MQLIRHGMKIEQYCLYQPDLLVKKIRANHEIIHLNP